MSAVAAPAIQQEAVPEKLINTAIDLYGSRGTQAVSAREIIRAAGVLNEAAVRYYFGNKEGLLAACMQQIADELHALMSKRWQQLEQRKQSRDASKQDRSTAVREVVSAVLFGLVELLAQRPSSVQLLARMIREEGALGQDLLLSKCSAEIFRFESELALLLPDKSEKALRLHAILAFNSLVNGMVDMGLLNRLPAVGITVDEFYKQPNTAIPAAHFQLHADELMHGFLDYVTGGICSPDTL